MASKNYEKGRAREYRIKRTLEKHGLYVVRSAGSHSFFDLIAIDTKHKMIWLLQVKEKPSKKDYEQYKLIATEFDGLYWVKTKLIRTAKEVLKEYENE